MTFSYETTVELANIEVNVEIEFSADYVDNGIGAYEFWGAHGVHHDYGWEVEEVRGMCASEDIRDAVKRALTPDMFSSRKRYLKAIRRSVRQVTKALASAEPSEYISDDVMIEACGDAPDYGPDDDGYNYHDYPDYDGE